MSYTSVRNKQLIEFPDGKLMLLSECSDNNVRDERGQRCWDMSLWHPKGTLFFTKETLKQERENYVEHQFELLRDFSRLEVERGWAQEYKEPTLDSIDYNGTVWPGGRKIKNGRAFFGGNPKRIEDYSREYNAARRIIFDVCDDHYNTLFREDYKLTDEDLDERYNEAMKKGKVFIGIRSY